jgi:plasmid stability protein
MATLVIRNVEDSLRTRLKARAAAHGHSMEEEIRQVLRSTVVLEGPPTEGGLGSAIRALFEPIGGVELPEIEREVRQEPPDFSGPGWDDDRRP